MRALFLSSLITILAGASGAAAEDAPRGSEAARCHQVRPGLVQCTEQQVYGEAPRTFYVLSRTAPRYEAPPLRRDDLARQVARTVRRSPF